MFEAVGSFPFERIPQPTGTQTWVAWSDVKPENPRACGAYLDCCSVHAVNRVRYLADRFVGREEEEVYANLDPYELVALTHCGLLGALARFRKKAQFSRALGFWMTAMLELAVDPGGEARRVQGMGARFIAEFVRRSREASKFPRPSAVLREVGWNWSKAFVPAPKGTGLASLVGAFGLDIASVSQDMNAWEQAVDATGEREAVVLRMRHGLDGHEEATLGEIGRLPKMGLCRERIRQLEEKACHRLFRRARATGLLPMDLRLVFGSQD